MGEVDIDDVSKLIAGVCPGYYTTQKEDSGPMDISGFKKALSEDFLKALGSIGDFNLKPGSGASHTLVYDSSSEGLEPVYFWILDAMNGAPMEVDKLVDNFSASPGSGHFADMGARATRMQEEGMKIMQTIGVLVKSLVNIIYDLKEFELRMSQYKSAKSKNKNEAEAGILGLKQIWMDNVDIKRGRGSINMLAQDLQFVTLRDAFMMANSVEDVKKIDLNDRVKRMLEPRVLEFLKWKELSEQELTKRYEIERAYLKNQVSALQLYTRWAKPYLKAASQLQQKNMKNPALVTAFDTTIMQLTLLGKIGINPAKTFFSTGERQLPEAIQRMNFKRKYYACVLVEFVFRGIPQKAGQHYTFGGRVEVRFKAFALNNEELDILKEELEKSDLNEALKFAEGMTTESLDVLREDIDYFTKPMEEREKEGEKEESKKGEDTNPFLALIGLDKKKDKKKGEKGKEKKKLGDIKPDSYAERMVRRIAQGTAEGVCFTLFDVYKKAHGMSSYPIDYDYNR